MNSFDKIYKKCGFSHRVISTSDFEGVAHGLVAPVIVMYTSWIIDRAEKMGIKRLYFLARDGYLMRDIGEKICSERNNGIVCSYFYCSRYALRMAAYGFFDDSAYEKLFLGAFKLSACGMLLRADFSPEERQRVYNDIGFTDDENRILGRGEFSAFTDKVRQSEVFKSIVKEKSDRAYSLMTEYIKQEEMDRQNKIGIIDLGWTGSLQLTLQRILSSMGINSPLVGFYMGMIDKPPAKENSQYNSWLFTEKDNCIKSRFAHNLIECLCSAPHGMTMGFKKAEQGIVPVLADKENDERYINIIRQKALDFVADNKTEYKEYFKKATLKILLYFMYKPDKNTATSLGVYSFCDDVSEGYHRSIVQKGEKKDYSRELIFYKLLHRDDSDGFYWYYGSLAAGDIGPKWYYRIMYRLTRYISFIIH